jgi:hypothetical protein
VGEVIGPGWSLGEPGQLAPTEVLSMGIAGRSASFFRSVSRTVHKNDGTGKQYLLAGLRNGERSHKLVSMTAQVVPKCADAPSY